VPINSSTTIPDLHLPNTIDVAQVDMRWADETSQEPSGEDEAELKTYTNDMIKESIRVRVGLSLSVSPFIGVLRIFFSPE